MLEKFAKKSPLKLLFDETGRGGAQRIGGGEVTFLAPPCISGEVQNHYIFASIPFGGGHRQCIGQDLARLN